MYMATTDEQHTDEWFLIQGLKKCLVKNHPEEESYVPLFQILSLESAPQQAQDLQVNAVITQVLLHFTK
ncbi:hypothetical protein ACJX0J_019616, partial [Zea mays]